MCSMPTVPGERTSSAPMVADECASRQLGDLMGGRKSNDDKTGRQNNATPESSVERRYRPMALRRQVGPVATVGGDTGCARCKTQARSTTVK